MNNILLHFKKLDWIMIVAAVLLVVFGLASIYSSSVGRDDFSNFKKQIVFLAAGIFLMFLFSFLDWRALKEDSFFVWALYLGCLALLLGLFFLAPEIRGTKSWYKIGFLSFDPIEFLKIILIVVLAKYFSRRHVEMYKIRHIILSGIYVFLPSLIIFFQPNLGSASVLVAAWLGILIISGISLRQFLVLAFCFFLIFLISWNFFLKDYQKDRITNFFSPADPLGMGWSQNQSKIAIGAGGFLGQGLGKGSQTQYGFLPEPQTDFIFSAISEETGLVGGTALFLLFSVLIWRIMKTAFSASTNFARILASGFVVLLASQIFINIGMNLGILPIVGVSLPFISYGGSSLIALFVFLGIIQSAKTKA